MFIEESLEDALVKKLIERGPSTVKELEDALQTNGNFSQRAIYRSLQRLEELTIITKLKTFYILDLSWLSQQAEKWREAYEKQLQHISLEQILSDQDRNVWKFTNIRFANLFCLQILMSLMHTDQGKKMYVWTNHPWYNFCTGEAEDRFNETINLWGGKIYRIIGGDTWLDRESQNIWEKAESKNKYGLQSFESHKNNVLAVIGNYVLVMKLGKKSVDLIEEIYIKATQQAKADQYLVQKLLNSSDNFVVELTNSASKASKIAKEFTRFFDGS